MGASAASGFLLEPPGLGAPDFWEIRGMPTSNPVGHMVFQCLHSVKGPTRVTFQIASPILDRKENSEVTVRRRRTSRIQYLLNTSDLGATAST